MSRLDSTSFFLSAFFFVASLEVPVNFFYFLINREDLDARPAVTAVCTGRDMDTITVAAE